MPPSARVLDNQLTRIEDGVHHEFWKVREDASALMGGG
jgi:hypothetical protein